VIPHITPVGNSNWLYIVRVREHGVTTWWFVGVCPLTLAALAYEWMAQKCREGVAA
jgi:hypothetical protein